ncbi:kinase-like protein [Ceratobasidium sp. AG-I]|nr:kinase-like protein [Ceratobasidium sp. AG-I]
MYVWSKCRHPNVLEPLGVAKFCGEMCLVSPWMENGKLLSYITSNPGVDRCLACAQIARGLAFIHAHDIVHGDLKADNVLVSQDGEVKLTDFGNTILKTYTLRFSGKVNASGPSLRWAAPELLSEGGMFTIPADVYALGMVCETVYLSLDISNHLSFALDNLGMSNGLDGAKHEHDIFLQEVITGNVPHHTVKDIGIPMKVVDKREIPERPVNYMPSRSSQANVLWGLLVQCWAYEAEDRLAANMVEKTVSLLVHLHKLI